MQAQQERKHAMEQIKLQMSEALLSSMLGGFTARRTLCTSEPGEKGAPEAVAESRVLKEQKITLSPEQELAVGAEHACAVCNSWPVISRVCPEARP